MNDPLTKAILAAGRELGLEYGWTFDGESYAPKVNSIFTRVLLKHLAPLTKEARKDFLAAQLSATSAKLCAIAAKLKELEEHP